MNIINALLRIVATFGFLYAVGMQVGFGSWAMGVSLLGALVAWLILFAKFDYGDDKLAPQFRASDVILHGYIRIWFCWIFVQGMVLTPQLGLGAPYNGIIGGALLAAVLFNIWRFFYMTWQSIDPPAASSEGESYDGSTDETLLAAADNAEVQEA